jgi:hypothetical protein
MGIVVDPSYQHLHKSSNANYYKVNDHILLVFPELGVKDDAVSAVENVKYQMDYARSLGHRVGLIVVMSYLLSQDKDSRDVYINDITSDLCYGTALVVTNPLSRAIGSFFIGLSRPLISTKLFNSIDDSVIWLNQQSK